MDELLAIADHECLEMWKNMRFGYTEPKGMPQLRQALAIANYDNFTAENILMFAGAEEGIFCTFNTILSSHDHVIVVTPCYQSLKSIAESICAVTAIDLSIDTTNTWSLNLTTLSSLIIPGQTKLIICNFPHNPTGTALPPNALNGLIDICRAHNLFLFCDEVYRGIHWTEDNAVPQPVAVLYERGISLSGVSKSHGLPGLRIGWIACQDHSILTQISDNKHYLSICNSAPSEILALIAVRQQNELFARNKTIIASNLTLFQAFIDRYPGKFTWIPPKGGCVGFLRILPSAAKKVDLMAVAEQLVHEHGLLILPGGNFPANQKTLQEEYLRIGLGRKSFPQALEVLERILFSYFE